MLFHVQAKLPGFVSPALTPEAYPVPQATCVHVHHQCLNLLIHANSNHKTSSCQYLGWRRTHPPELLNPLNKEVRGLKVLFFLAIPSKSRKPPHKAQNAGIAKESRLSDPELLYLVHLAVSGPWMPTTLGCPPPLDAREPLT